MLKKIFIPCVNTTILYLFNYLTKLLSYFIEIEFGNRDQKSVIMCLIDK